MGFEVMAGEVDITVGDVSMRGLLHGGPMCRWGWWGTVWVHVADGRWRRSVHGFPIAICSCINLAVLFLLGGASGLFGLGGGVTPIGGVVLALGVMVGVVGVVGMLAARRTNVPIRRFDGTEVFSPAIWLGDQRSILCRWW